MPPKKQPKAKGAADSGLAPSPAQSQIIRADNTSYLQDVYKDVEIVLNHFPDLKGQDALGLEHGGDLAEFNLDTMMKTYATTGSYMCTFNVSKLSLQPATPELPLSQKKKALLTSAYYTAPAKCKQLLCGLDKDIDGEEMARLLAECALPVCFPIEHLHAWWAGFAAAFGRGDAQELQSWRKSALTCVVQFKHMVNDDIVWNSMQGRENIQTDYEALRCTPLMRVLNFGAFKVRCEASGGWMSAANLLKQYKNHLQLSARSEKLTPGWVDSACTFLNRMYIIPQVAKLLQEADELLAGTNPLEGTTKLQAIISKARTSDKICLVVESIMDAHRAGFYSTPPPVSFFLGQQPGSCGKGLVDLILFKWDVARYILDDWSPTRPFRAEALVEMKRVLHRIETYRKQCGYPSDRRDMTFRAGWAPSSEELFTLVESIVFDVMYDSHLKDALKSSASPADCAAKQLKEFLDPIAQLVEAEKKDRTTVFQNIRV